MKVLHLLQSNRFSGAENVVCQIISMMKDEPDLEMLYCSRDGQIREALEEREITFAPVKALTVDHVKEVIKEQQPDIIHAHDMRASFTAARACGKIPLISHIHNNNFDSRGISPKSIAYLYAGIKAKHIFWVSQSSFNGYAFHSMMAKKSSVLYNVIDVGALYQKMELDPNTYDYDVVYMGRLSYPKDPFRLLRIFQMLVLKLPKVKIAVVGTGELEAETLKLAQEYGLQNNVEFLGFQSNPLKVLHDSKVMIMTSRWEGTPMCALEAMALGVPVVSTPTDGLKDLIRSGENGYLSNDDEELAERLITVIQDKQISNALSGQIQKDAKRINDIKAYRKELLKAYKG